tara:strand:- start:160 stop:597 length:438 start_codon:yes stop_codon:yes gene_type:complete
MSKIAVRNSIEYNEKKYPMMNVLFNNIDFDKSIVSSKHKIINMKKLMRKYIDEVDLKRVEYFDKGLKGGMPKPTNATHIWYNEALRYLEEIIRLKHIIDNDTYKKDYEFYHQHFLRVKGKLAEEKQITSKLYLENQMLKEKLNAK